MIQNACLSYWYKAVILHGQFGTFVLDTATFIHVYILVPSRNVRFRTVVYTRPAFCVLGNPLMAIAHYTSMGVLLVNRFTCTLPGVSGWWIPFGDVMTLNADGASPEFGKGLVLKC